MRAVWTLLLVTTLGACTAISTKKVDSGDNRIDERMVVKLDGAWNEITVPETNSQMRAALDVGPAHVWTMEGLPIDRLLVYSGVKDGEAVHPVRSGANSKRFNFRSTMQADEIVAMFEGMLTRDGSTFKLAKLEPASFGGAKGIRFEYAMVRKADNVPLSGIGFATVDHGELFALVYIAPRLGFFPRYRARVEGIAQSVSISPPGAAPAQAAPAAQPVRSEVRCATVMECRNRGVWDKDTARKSP